MFQNILCLPPKRFYVTLLCLETYNGPERNWRQLLMHFGGQIKCIMGHAEVSKSVNSTLHVPEHFDCHFRNGILLWNIFKITQRVIWFRINYFTTFFSQHNFVHVVPHTLSESLEQATGCNIECSTVSGTVSSVINYFKLFYTLDLANFINAAFTSDVDLHSKIRLLGLQRARYLRWADSCGWIR